MFTTIQKIKKFHCEQCPFKAKNKDKLKDHTIRVHEVTHILHKCELCDYQSKMLRDLKVHKANKHAEDRLKYRCTECEYSSAWAANIRRHFKTTHENVKAFTCDICGQSFTGNEGLKKHQYSVHGVDNLPKHKCTIPGCEFETIHMNVLKRHIIANHETKPEKCSLCSKVLKNSITLKLHMNKMHSDNKKVYKCPACPKEFFKLVSQKEHTEVEHAEGEKVKHQCDSSSYWSYRKSALYRHNRNVHKM